MNQRQPTQPRPPRRRRRRPPPTPDLDTWTTLLRGHIDQLERRMIEQTSDLRRAIDDLRALLETSAAATLARIDAHEEYHARNEHRWGLIKLAARHPFRFAAAAAALLTTLGALRPDSAEALARAIIKLLS